MPGYIACAGAEEFELIRRVGYAVERATDHGGAGQHPLRHAEHWEVLVAVGAAVAIAQVVRRNEAIARHILIQVNPQLAVGDDAIALNTIARL